MRKQYDIKKNYNFPLLAIFVFMTGLSACYDNGSTFSRVELGEFSEMKLAEGERPQKRQLFTENQTSAHRDINSTQVKHVSLSASGSYSSQAADNHDPNSAIYINTDTVYADTLTAEGQENWYYVYIASPGKLTTFMQTVNNPSIDYDLTFFELNTETSTLENPKYSMYGPQMNEQLAYIAEPGYYYIRMNSYVGFDTENPYYFIVTYSDSYDNAEPDDNIWQATGTDSTFSVDQGLDNFYDQDWFSYTVSETSLLEINFNSPGSSDDLSVDIFDSNLVGVDTLQELSSTQYISLTKGSYFLRVSSASGAQAEYTLSTVSNCLYKQAPSYALYATGTCKQCYADPNACELKVNGKLVPFEWERHYEADWGSGYTQRTQTVSYNTSNIYDVPQFGSYSATHYGSVSNAFRIKVSKVIYMHHYSYYQSGNPPTYISDFSDVAGLPTPRTTDEFDDVLPEFGPLHLIINADTGEVVDFDAGLNFYYYKASPYDSSIETRSFSPLF